MSLILVLIVCQKSPFHSAVETFLLQSGNRIFTTDMIRGMPFWPRNLQAEPTARAQEQATTQDRCRFFRNNNYSIDLEDLCAIARRTLEPMELQTLKDLYIHELKDLFSAEQQIVKALPKMAKAASNKELVAGFQEHLEQTKQHAQRLEQILTSHEQTTRGPKCKGMAGVVAEGAEMIEEEADVEVKDAGLIAVAQRVEHYEMAGYGTARTYAELLGDKEGAKLLALTLEEERQTDQKLSQLAKSAVNVAAAK
jgi:ferritin-like metal-binding protein YciE